MARFSVSNACGTMMGLRSERGKAFPKVQKVIKNGVRGATVKTTACAVLRPKRCRADVMSIRFPSIVQR